MTEISIPIGNGLTFTDNQIDTNWNPDNISSGVVKKTPDGIYIESNGGDDGGDTPSKVTMNAPFIGKFKVTQIYSDTHDGLDIACLGNNDELHATVTGKVIHAGWENDADHSQGFGIYVCIQSSADNNFYYYGHMKETLNANGNLSLPVKVNDNVLLGQAIGYQGSTGKSTGPHCHYCVRPKYQAGVSLNISTISGIPNVIGEYNTEDYSNPDTVTYIDNWTVIPGSNNTIEVDRNKIQLIFSFCLYKTAGVGARTSSNIPILEPQTVRNKQDIINEMNIFLDNGNNSVAYIYKTGDFIMMKGTPDPATGLSKTYNLSYTGEDANRYPDSVCLALFVITDIQRDWGNHVSDITLKCLWSKEPYNDSYKPGASLA